MSDEYANGTENNDANYQQEYQEGLTEGDCPPQSTDPDDGNRINASKHDDDDRKLFVGGLSWETETQHIKEYFSKFGEVMDCVVKTDPETTKSRGFGFVLFKEQNAIDKVLAVSTHSLHGRNIDPKRAKARTARDPVKKVFVGGLDPDLPVEAIREHFSVHGKIEEIDLPFDKAKNQRRQFCFITFESEKVVDAVCEEAKQIIGGKEVDVKKATPKQDRHPGGYDESNGGGWAGPRWGNGPGDRGRGRGRGRGGYNNQGGWGNQG
ncbi:unnamed protein product, partial [Owenia fusiformis]